MKKYLIIALSGLLASCSLNSERVTSPSKQIPPSVSEVAASEIITVRRAGNPNGRTVILVPGLASSPDVWQDTSEALQDYDLRLIHVAGFAGAPAFEASGSTDNKNFTDSIARAINSHIQDMPGRSPVVIGHSMGGIVGLKTSMAENSQIETVIIVDSLPFLAAIFIPGATPEQAKQMAPQMMQTMATMPRERFDKQQDAGLARLVKTSSYKSVISKWGKTSDQGTVASVMGELLATDLRSELPKANAQITVLAAHDKVMGMPVSQLRGLYESQYKLAPNHEVIVIEDSLHFIMIDQKDAFINQVKQVLKD